MESPGEEEIKMIEVSSGYVLRNAEDYDVFTRQDVLKDNVLDVEKELKEVFK